jgi:type IX secretion system substrate protein
MIMKRLLFLMLLYAFANTISSQSLSPEVISTSGEIFQGTYVEIEWTIGEMVIDNIQNSNHQITQGFHQPYYTITSLTNLPEEIGSINVSPNPTSETINIELSFNVKKRVTLYLSDIHGKSILVKEIHCKNIIESLSLSNVNAGIYFLNLQIDDTKYPNTFKILKN